MKGRLCPLINILTYRVLQEPQCGFTGAQSFKEIAMGRDYGLIGRQTEIERLEKAYASSRSEFVALYGRRRVGKTFLIEQVFKERMVFNLNFG